MRQPNASPRVLVVDDDDAVREFAARALRMGGYEVLAAAHGQEALQLTEQQARQFDLFLIDWVMPEMTGSDLAAVLRRRDPDVKVLYLTGFGDALFNAKGTLWEHEAFLEKPTTVNGLLQAVSLALYGHTQGPPRTSRPE
jgi:two-component system, cell cycle sensor histidine kinase and response regulator CckA